MAYLTILSGQLAVTEKPRLLLVCDLSRAVARAMKTWATVRAKEKKNQLNSTRHFLNGAGDGSNRRIGGPTQDVTPSISQIKNLTASAARKCQKNPEG